MIVAHPGLFSYLFLYYLKCKCFRYNMYKFHSVKQYIMEYVKKFLDNLECVLYVIKFLIFKN